MLHAVILAGGGGTRLWPLSRTHYPKQLLSLLGERTLLQQTVLRLDGFVPSQQTWIVTSKEQELLVTAQLSALSRLTAPPSQVLVEPIGRNTAAAIGLAAIHLQRVDSQAVMVVLPADHWIERPDVFLKIVQTAQSVAEQGMLVTFAVIPDRAETGYGYIQRGKAFPLAHGGPTGTEVYRVERFVEKPDARTAQAYVSTGDYYWNTGIFLFRASTVLEEIAFHLPALYEGLMRSAQSLESGNAQETLDAVYSRLESVSIDHGVFEKSTRLVTLAVDIGWSDLGEWTAIHRLSPQDAQGNTLSPNVLDVGSKNSFIYGNDTRRTIATIGLKDMVVVDAEDALLVCPSDRVQEVRTVVRELQTRGAEVAHFPRTVPRPWGSYTILQEGDQYKVKHVIVYPEASLSLQFHRHRSEHWVVVRGTAQVTNGDQEYLLQPNQSTYISAGTKHRLANPGSEPLEIIEVQTGPYVGEDDIVRLTDLYGRVSS
jgi:mannose-1-phosphate guanylyltransferase/mannose-6-phosphate isomerase